MILRRDDFSAYDILYYIDIVIIIKVVVRLNK